MLILSATILLAETVAEKYFMDSFVRDRLALTAVIPFAVYNCTIST